MVYLAMGAQVMKVPPQASLEKYRTGLKVEVTATSNWAAPAGMVN